MSPELEAANKQVAKRAGQAARLREHLRVKEQAFQQHLTACTARDAEMEQLRAELDRARAIAEAAYGFVRDAERAMADENNIVFKVIGPIIKDLRRELDYAADGGPEYRPCICFETPHLDALRKVLMVDGDADYADGVLGEWQAAIDKLKDGGAE